MRAWRALRAGEATLPLHLFPPSPHGAGGRPGLARAGGVGCATASARDQVWKRAGGSSWDRLPSAVPCGQAVPPRSPLPRPHPGPSAQAPAGSDPSGLEVGGAPPGCGPGPGAPRGSPSPTSVCCFVSGFFFSYVWVFSWGCFIGIPVIKTWCSLGALMWPAAWAGPSLFSPLGRVWPLEPRV